MCATQCVCVWGGGGKGGGRGGACKDKRTVLCIILCSYVLRIPYTKLSHGPHLKMAPYVLCGRGHPIASQMPLSSPSQSHSHFILLVTC